ncbi:MAG: hypothetical protein JRI68_23435 [Deltaproteobacteria bacterium]|nr:hypothetical protein [Deltaproteobacteria bacterium]
MSDSEPEPEAGQSDDEAARADEPNGKQRGKSRKQRKRGKRGTKRPAFARAYPKSSELDRLLAAFDAGNYGLVRTDAAALAERTGDEELRAAALDLRRRVHADPTSIYLWAIGVALLLFLFGYYLMR